MTTLDDRIALMGRYTAIADLKDFTRLPSLVYTDSMTLDFGSVIGLPPMTVPLDEYVQVLGQVFAPFSATHHTITGHVVEIDGDRAPLQAHVRAEHRVPQERAGGGPPPGPAGPARSPPPATTRSPTTCGKPASAPWPSSASWASTTPPKPTTTRWSSPAVKPCATTASPPRRRKRTGC